MSLVTLLNGTQFRADAGKTLLDAALAQGVMLEHSCRTGRCGSCKATVLSGATVTLGPDTCLSADERNRGVILTCAAEAHGDLSLDIEDLKALAGIRVLTLPARIDSLTSLAPDVVQVTLRLPPRSDMKFLAGQYVDVIGPGGVRRSYSVASDASKPDRLELQIRKVEGGTLSKYWFDDAQANDLLRFQGPRGTFYLRDPAARHVVFLATGTGFAPVQAMLHQLAGLPTDRRPASVTLYWGGRRPEDLYVDLSAWIERAGLRYVPVLSKADAQWAGARGHVQNVMLANAGDLTTTDVYACGSQAMIEGARESLLAAGLPAKQFHSDAFVSSSV